MPHDTIGWIHTIAAIIALISGSMILAQAKGTATHKKVGRVYGIAMLVVCATSFMIYRVHNSFGVLHFFAIVSTITLALGMLPMHVKGYENPRLTHLAWMYWSVIGLYCAFASEVFTRLPYFLELDNNYGTFYALVGVASGLVGMLGGRYFRHKKAVWEAQFGAKHV